MDALPDWAGKEAPNGGTEVINLQDLYEEGDTSQKKPPCVQFAFEIQRAAEDVDEDDLIAYLTAKDGSVKAIGEIVIKNNSTRFYTTTDSMFRLTDFMDHCGIDQ